MLFRLPAKLNHEAIPWVTYTDPELGHVGLTWAEAVERYTEAGLRRVDWELAENDRARAERRVEGMVRNHHHKEGPDLGASILAPHAGEMIHAWALAITKKMNISAMAEAIAPYPSWSEASKRAAGAYFTDSLFSKRTRKGGQISFEVYAAERLELSVTANDQTGRLLMTSAPTEEHFDYVIIGSGSAGSAIAYRLAELPDNPVSQ